MNKRMMLAALLLVSVAAAVSGTDFEERITEKKWYRDYFNEVIYRKDRNIIVEYQPYLTEEENINFYDDAYADMIFWFDESARYRDCISWNRFDDGEYGSYISIGMPGFRYKAKKLTPDLYKLELEDVRISQELYESFLEDGYDLKFALDATEPEYSLYFRFDGEYLYIYLDDGKTLYATYCAYDESEIVALQEAIRTNEFDISEFTLPRYADGSWDFANGKGINIKKIVGGTYQVKENLQLRETEGTSGEIITTIQADTCVEILSLGKEDTIDGITDNWVKVELLWGAKNLVGDLVMGETGWCFGGYLKAGYYEEPELFVPPETTNETESEIENIFNYYFENISDNKYVILYFVILLIIHLPFIFKTVKIIKAIKARKKGNRNGVPVSSLVLIGIPYFLTFVLLICFDISQIYTYNYSYKDEVIGGLLVLGFSLSFISSNLLYPVAGIVEIVRKIRNKKRSPVGLGLVITGEIAMIVGIIMFFLPEEFPFLETLIFLVVGNSLITAGTLYHTDETENT